MVAIFRKLRCDLRSNRIQRTFILLLLVFATAALTTSLTVRARGGTAWEELYREANGAHAWFYGEEDGLAEVAARPEVRALAGPYPTTQVEVPSLRGPGGRGFPIWLEGIGLEQPKIDRPVVVSGRWLRGDGEVVLGRRFADEHGFRPGDTITVGTSEGIVELRVAGIAVFAGRSPFSLPAIAWVTPGTLTGPLEARFAALAIQLEHRGQARAFRDALEMDLGDRAFFLVEDWNNVRAQNDEATAVISIFLGIFSLFALVSASFVIVNAISGRILARYRDIGLMKAIGFTPRQVTGGLLIEQCGLALIAVAIGLALGTWLVPVLDDPASKEFETRSLGYFRPGLALAIASGVVLLVAVATLVPALRAGRIPVVRAITLGPGRASTKPSAMAALANTLRLPVWLVVGMKDAFERPVRTWLTVAALVLAVVTVTFVVTSEWTVRQLLSRPELIGEPFELQVDSDLPQTLEAEIMADPEVETYFQRSTLSITPEGKEEEVTLAALGPGYEKLDWQIWEGRLFSAPGEATVGKGFLTLMDVEVGDTVELMVLGKPVRLKIVGAYRATEDGGRWAMTSVETARQQVGEDVEVNGFAVALKAGADSRLAAERYRRAGATDIERFDHAADGVNAVRGVLGSLGLMLLLVGLVSLVNTVSTGIRERQRDLGILKAVGMTPRQVVGSVVTGAAVLTLVALVVGLPLGVLVSIWISNGMGNSLGWGPGLFERAPVLWLAAIVPAMLAAVLLAALIPAGAAARLRANEALRSE